MQLLLWAAEGWCYNRCDVFCTCLKSLFLFSKPAVVSPNNFLCVFHLNIKLNYCYDLTWIFEAQPLVEKLHKDGIYAWSMIVSKVVFYCFFPSQANNLKFLLKVKVKGTSCKTNQQSNYTFLLHETNASFFHFNLDLDWVLHEKMQ